MTVIGLLNGTMYELFLDDSAQYPSCHNLEIRVIKVIAWYVDEL